MVEIQDQEGIAESFQDDQDDEIPKNEELL